MKIERRPVPVALGYCALNWVIPGAGYLAARDIKRGLALVAILNGIFFAGLLYDGYLVRPPFPGEDGFNIVAFLTFLVQACHGAGCGLLLLAPKVGGVLESALVRNMGAAYSDLGGFHFLVAGGLNYFATVRLYDLVAGNPGPESDEHGISGIEAAGSERDGEGER